MIYAQPSVIKVGGITEYLKVAALADEMGVKLAPHSPYFGPGFLATLQLISLRDDGSFIEVFYMNRAACLWRGRIDVDAKGTIAVLRRAHEGDTSTPLRALRANLNPSRSANHIAIRTAAISDDPKGNLGARLP